MHLLHTKLMLGDVQTISLPTDSIFIVSLLIVFTLIVHFFNNILSIDTNQYAQTIDNDSNFELVKKKLEDQLALDSTTLDGEKIEKSGNRQLNFLPPSKVLGLSSLVIAIGGASLLGLQNMQKTYEGVSTSRSNTQLDTQSSIFNLKPHDKTQTKIKTISYIDTLLLTNQSSPDRNIYKTNRQPINSNFSF